MFQSHKKKGQILKGLMTLGAFDDFKKTFHLHVLCEIKQLLPKISNPKTETICTSGCPEAFFCREKNEYFQAIVPVLLAASTQRLQIIRSWSSFSPSGRAHLTNGNQRTLVDELSFIHGFILRLHADSSGGSIKCEINARVEAASMINHMTHIIHIL